MLSLVGLVAGPQAGTDLWSRFERFAYRGIAVLLVLFLGARLLEAALGVPHHRTEWIVIGAGVMWCGIGKPTWFWNHPRALWVRDMAGDRGATIIYVLLGALMIGVGLLNSSDGDSATPNAPPNPRMQPTGRTGAGHRVGGALR